MKKFLLLITLFFSFVWISNAWRRIDWLTIYPTPPHMETEIITSCDNNNTLVWGYVQYPDPVMWFPITITEIDLNDNCWENEEIIEEENNPITSLANDTWSWAIAEAGNIMDGPIGYLVYFTIWLLIISLIIFAIKKFF